MSMGHLPTPTAKKLLQLAHGETLPASTFNKKWLTLLEQEGIVKRIQSGRTRSRMALNSVAALDGYLKNNFNIANLGEYIESRGKEDLSGHEAQMVAGDTKLRKARTFKGFLVNVAEPIEASLNSQPLHLKPTEGTFTFIYDFENFAIPERATVVGIENPENFRQVQKQKQLFPAASLFVSRYPFSSDLKKWLLQIPNPYLHFGDFDLAGIAIFENEFKPILNERANFFIPENIEQLIALNGNRGLYNLQHGRYRNLRSGEVAIQRLIDIINRKRKGLEQEFFIRRT